MARQRRLSWQCWLAGKWRLAQDLPGQRRVARKRLLTGRRLAGRQRRRRRPMREGRRRGSWWQRRIGRCRRHRWGRMCLRCRSWRERRLWRRGRRQRRQRRHGWCCGWRELSIWIRGVDEPALGPIWTMVGQREGATYARLVGSGLPANAHVCVPMGKLAALIIRARASLHPVAAELRLVLVGAVKDGRRIFGCASATGARIALFGQSACTACPPNEALSIQDSWHQGRGRHLRLQQAEWA